MSTVHSTTYNIVSETMDSYYPFAFFDISIPVASKRFPDACSRTPAVHTPSFPWDILPDVDLLGDVCGDASLDDLLKGVSKSYERQELNLDREYLERRFKGVSEELEKLSICSSATRRKLRKLWSSTAKLSHGRAHCRGRSFSRRCLYLRQYLELVLDFESLDPMLKAGGRLDYILRQAERFLMKSTVSCSSHFKFSDSMIPSRTLGNPFWAEYREAQSRLQQIYAYEELLETEYQTVESQLQQLRSVEDALDEEQRQKEEEKRQFEIYMEHIERFIREVAIRLRIFLEFLYIFCKFSGFSDSHQPVCMTMPWNIRPALVVLWGVCWMFYYPQGYVDPTEIQHTRVDGDAGLSGIGKSRRPIESPFLHAEIFT